jgi:hypothetical protein
MSTLDWACPNGDNVGGCHYLATELMRPCMTDFNRNDVSDGSLTSLKNKPLGFFQANLGVTRQEMRKHYFSHTGLFKTNDTDNSDARMMSN